VSAGLGSGRERLLPFPRQQLSGLALWGVGDASEHISEPGLRIDVVELRRLCRPPNYAERFWKQAVVCARLRPMERTSPQFHSA
jgi:hypothetical protein